MKGKENIMIIGAGLCGSLLAIRMAQRGYNITLIEKRPDLRKVDISAGRSINLAFSDRGMKGIKLVGLQDKVKKLCIPMNGRMIHDAGGNTFFSAYSGREDEYINSISRGDLNSMLLDKAEAMPNITIQFGMGCKKVDLENAQATFKDYTNGSVKTMKADLILATDGAGSVLRRSMYLHKKFLFSFSQDYLGHGYKELTIPAAVGGGYRTEKNALHIWPRGEEMLIALPNLDGSFTVTLFLAYEDGNHNFNQLVSPGAILSYFSEQFPDAVALMPNLVSEFQENPVGPLGTIKCSPWHSYGKTLLLGDAAHAIVPFYGQGMNASFEDVVVFDGILDNHTGNWNDTFKAYEKARKKDTDAIADLAVDNFHEMKEHTASQLFQQKRALETAFEKEFPNDYHSKYSLVTFNEDIPYSQAMKRGRAQDKAILNLIDDGRLPDDMPLKEKLEIVKAETEDMLHDDAVVKNLS